MTRITKIGIIIFTLLFVSLSSNMYAFSLMGSGDGYVGNSTTDDLAIFTQVTGPVTGGFSLLPEGNYPYDATIRPDGAEVWIAGASGDGVVIVDIATNAITGRISSPCNYCINVTFTKDSKYALVSGRDSEDVTVIDTATRGIVTTISIPTYYLGAGNMALNPCSGDVYVVDWYDQTMFVIDTSSWTVTSSHTLGISTTSLWQLVVSPDGKHVFITDRGTDHVRVIETSTFTEVKAIPVGDDPWGIDITPDGKWIYVANEDSHNLSVIDTATLTVTKTLPFPATDADPRDVDFDLQGDYAYVPSGGITGNDNVYVIRVSDHTVVRGIDINPYQNPNVVAVAPQMSVCKTAPTVTPTGAVTRSPTATPSVTPSGAPTRTPTLVLTDTPTPIPTDTPTATHTFPYTPPATSTFTSTPAASSTPLMIPDTGREGLLVLLLGMGILLVCLTRWIQR